MRRRVPSLLIAACALGIACHREPPALVDKVEVSGPTVVDNTVLGLSPGQIQAELTEALRREGHFAFPKDGERPPPEAHPVRFTLELAFTREAQKQGRAGTYAEVGATLTIARRSDEGFDRYEVAGLGELKEPESASAAVRQESVRKALRTALDNAASGAHLQLAALGKTDAQLVADLKSEDLRPREYALRVLAERHNPAAVPVLLEKLKSQDADEVRRSIGLLVELRDPRAVPPLIDLARGKDPLFLREIVYALGAIGGDEAEAYLYTMQEGHDQPAIRDAAKQALEELQTRNTHGAPADKTAAQHEGGHP